MNATPEKNSKAKVEYGSMDNISTDKKRTFTDISSLIIFSIFFIFYIAIGIYAFYNGDAAKVQWETDPAFERKMEFINNLLENLNDLRYVILSFISFALLLSVLYIVILRWIPGFFVYTAIIIECAVLTIFIISIPTFFFALQSQYSFSKLVSGIIFAILTSIKLYILKQVGTTVICEVIKESCRAILNFPSSIILSVFVFILEIFSVLNTLSIFSYLMTIQSNYKKVSMSPMDRCQCPAELMYDDGSDCDENVFNTMCKPIDGVGSCMMSSCISYLATPSYIYFFHVINLIFGLWLVTVIFYFGQMILSGTFATWYWTTNKKSIGYTTVSRNAVTIMKYHLGTLVHGTSPWVIVSIIRSVCSTFKMSKFWRQPWTMLVCWWTIFCKAADNGLILCAIHGKKMSRSIQMATDLCYRNPLRFYIMNKAIEWLAIFMTLFVVLITLPITFGYIASQSHEPTWIYTFLIAIIICALLMIFPILILLSISINTIILCIFDDLKNNEETKEKTYHMNRKLKDLLVVE